MSIKQRSLLVLSQGSKEIVGHLSELPIGIHGWAVGHVVWYLLSLCTIWADSHMHF